MTSPHPHLSDAAWEQRLPSPYEELEADDPIAELMPILHVVTPGDRARAPIRDVPSDAPVPPAGDLEEIGERFRLDRAASAYLEYPSWPVCCERPATLLGFDDLLGDGDPGATVHFTEGEIRADWGMNEEQAERAIAQLDDPTAPEPAARPTSLWGRFLTLGWKPWRDGYDRHVKAGREGLDGSAAFHCRACGRLYLGSYHSR